MKLLEPNAFRCDAVDVRCLRVFVSKARKIAPAHVVDEDHDEIRRCGESAQG